MKRALSLFAILFLANTAAAGSGVSTLSGHVPFEQMAHARELGRKSSDSRVQLAIVLHPRDPEGLASTLQRLYTPGDPLYHQFLTPEQFVAHYGPSDQQVDQVSQYLNARGIRVTNVHANHLVIDAEGSVSNIESAFQIELHEYLAADGRLVYGPNQDPSLGDEIASNLNGIVGLNNFSVKKPHFYKNSQPFAQQPNANINSFMTPSRIKSVYGLTSLSQTGSGETLALFELDGYTSSDVRAYASNFSLTVPTLSNILVDGASGVPGTGNDDGPVEVTLDIELAIAMAPGLSKILVYEAPNTDSGVIDTYSKIANDNLAGEVSSSWGQAENLMVASDFNSENTIFQQMALQGQSIFAAAGDSGAYGDSPGGLNSTLEVQDPSSQPYVTGVGGTTLTWTVSNTWNSETSWTPTAAAGGKPSEGGGGGISRQWSIPSWQSGLSTVANKGSSSMRMVPDVSLDSDPNTGYPIYYDGSWGFYGGTSCAAPLWAAFTALVNQQRVATAQSRLGFANPSIYQIGIGASSTGNFHDIADASTNLYYPATSGYDLTTGWGSINGSTLFDSLVAMALAPSAPALTLTPGALSITISWPANATSYTIKRSTSFSGPFSTLAAGLTSTTYTDSTVSYGTTYYYTIQATNAEGTSSSSTPKSSTPYPSAPGAPSALAASVPQ